ncbi:transposase [Leptothermofonsia sp. ETS-13]|uniref:transposase n=1 Tax=Leptothermofonsia sp. ETS-13 TaxID=3035696 RepID=UPI003B9FE89C
MTTAIYLEMGQWRMYWSFRVWRGKGSASPSQLACILLAQVPVALSRGRTVIVLADSEFGLVDFLAAVRKRSWRAVVGMRCNRKLADGCNLKQLYRNGKRGQQVYLEGISYPRTGSWFWLKRAEGKRELRFVVSIHSYSGVDLVRLGRRRWSIEGFFKTIKHRFGQSTKLGVYRWPIFASIAYLLAHWIDQWSLPPVLDWKAASDLALKSLFPSIVWF